MTDTKLICMNCNTPYLVDLIIPDWLWKEISPKPVEGFKGGGLLCGSCIMAKIESMNKTDFWYLTKKDVEGKCEKCKTEITNGCTLCDNCQWSDDGRY